MPILCSQPLRAIGERRFVILFGKRYLTEKEGVYMKLIGSRKLTWVICGTGVLLALAGVVFLPQMIPVHFANGIADDFGNKIEIFLFPVLLLIITILTGNEKVKYFLIYSSTIQKLF